MFDHGKAQAVRSPVAGYTMVETMLALLLTAWLLETGMQLYLDGYRSCLAGSREIEVRENLRVASQRIVDSLRQAAGLAVYLGDTGHPVSGSPAEGNLVLINGGSDGYRFDATEMELEERIGGVWLPVASHITWLSFCYDLEKGVVTITLKGGVDGGCRETVINKVQLRI